MGAGTLECTALVFGPDEPPARLGPCRVIWRPIVIPTPAWGVAGALLSLSGWADSVVFTSPRAPRYLYYDAEKSGLVEGLKGFLAGKRVYAIGPKTSGAVSTLFNVFPVTAKEYRGVELARLILSEGSRRVVGVRSPEALRDLPAILLENGAGYVELYSYIIRPCEECIEGLRGEGADYLVATSPMIAEIIAGLGLRGSYVAIGPSTSQALASRGVTPACTARGYTLEGVGECLAELEGARDGDRG